MTDSIDLLRIIARDGGRIDQTDRVKIALAAEELELALHANETLSASLLEANAHRLALTEQVQHLRKVKGLPDLQPWSISSGWIRL